MNGSLLWTGTKQSIYLSLGFVSHTGSSCTRGNWGAPLITGVIVGVVGVEPGIAAAAAASLCCRSYSTNSFREPNTFCIYNHQESKKLAKCLLTLVYVQCKRIDNNKFRYLYNLAQFIKSDFAFPTVFLCQLLNSSVNIAATARSSTCCVCVTNNKVNSRIDNFPLVHGTIRVHLTLKSVIFLCL